jgi:NADPH2:quinone reductase
MRAVQVIELAGPSGVRVVDVPEPEPRPGDAVVEVHAVGVSFPDLLLSQGLYQLKPDPPFTLGVDLAGTLVSAPEGVPGLVPGARVAGVLPFGGACERAVVPASAVLPLPDDVSYDVGAALPLNYLTALFALQERGRLRPGETVLVHGASGGVGTATLQVAKGSGSARSAWRPPTRRRPSHAPPVPTRSCCSTGSRTRSRS